MTARFGDIFNLIYLRSDESGKVVGHFTLYNVLGWQMVLAEQGGRPNVAVGLISNPLDPGTWSDSIATETEIDWDWLNSPALEDTTRGVARMSTMMEIYSRKATEREIEAIVGSVFVRHGITGDAVVSDEDAKKRVLGEISHRLASLLLRLPHEQRLSPTEIESMLGKTKL